jgi:mono/diheme cytochrome c family protein
MKQGLKQPSAIWASNVVLVMKNSALLSNNLKILSKRNLTGLALLSALGLSVFWLASAPHPLAASAIPAHTANLENGKLLFDIGGCVSCHGENSAGGKPLKTPIGTLYPPNLTADAETGLGKWTDVDFVNAMQKGLAPDGSHLIPAFPYTSYAHMKVEDVLDIKAYLAGLPAVKNQTPPHEVAFLPVIRRGLGLWKWIGLDDAAWHEDKTQSASWNRGAYLVNGPGHCSECHTPRTIFMSSDVAKLFQGGPHPEGKGKVPNLRDLAGRGRYKDANDLVLAFQNGEELGYDKMSSGGMGEVRKHIALLPNEDVAAIAGYVMSLK